MLIQIVLISNDHNYSYAVLTDLSAMGRKFIVSEMLWGENLSNDFEFALANGNYKTPTIVMLDFGFGRHDYELVTSRIDAIRDVMAIECIVLRPPADAALFADLSSQGLQIFDGTPITSVSAEAIH